MRCRAPCRNHQSQTTTLSGPLATRPILLVQAYVQKKREEPSQTPPFRNGVEQEKAVLFLLEKLLVHGHRHAVEAGVDVDHVARDAAREV